MLDPRPPRDLHIPDIQIVKEEPTTSKKVDSKPKSLFSVVKPVANPEVKSPQKKIETPPKPDEPTKAVKTEKSSPEEGKTATKAPAGKKIQLKNQKPVQKGSISSFFSNKPGTSKLAVEKPREKPVADKKEEVKTAEKNESKPVKSTEVVPVPAAKDSDKKKKQAAKKIKLKEPTGSKRSRIRVMQDSSDEEEEKEDIEEPESKLIKFDREFTPEQETSTVAVEDTPEKKPEVEKTKHKAKRWVTKRFQTEDGFMRTERVQEEYSASDGENDENKKKNSPPKEKAKAVKKSPADKKKKSNVTETQVGKKQATMMSFFTKK